MVGSACIVILVSLMMFFSFLKITPREYQLARIESTFPYPQDGVLPALPNPNFPPPIPLTPIYDPINDNGFPAADLFDMRENMIPPIGNPLPVFIPELAPPPAPLGVIGRMWQWYQQWLENIRLHAVPETVVLPRRR